MILKNLIYFVLLNLLASSTLFAEGPLSLEEYLQQVASNNDDYKAARSSETAAKVKMQDSDLSFYPFFNFEFQRSMDEHQSNMPAFTGTLTENKFFKAGVSEQTPFGLKAAVSYKLNYNNIEGLAIPINPPPELTFYSVSPTIEINQSLWRNGFGSEDRAQSRLIYFDAETNYYKAQYQKKALLVDAKNSFLHLYYVQQTMLALKASLAVSAQLREWAKKRVTNELGDKSDYLEAKAAADIRELELVKTENEMQTAARNFNSLRGIAADEVSDELRGPPEKLNLDKFKKTKTRLDVIAQEKSLELARTNSELGQEKVRPTLDFYASYGYSTLDPDQSGAIKKAFDTDFPVYALGFRFSTPLAVSKAYDVNRSFSRDIEASELSLRRKKQEEERDYKNLFNRIQNAGARLKLTEKLEETQKLKLEADRRRHLRGRITLYQVLQAEQDHVSAQLNRIQTEMEFNSAMNELELYNGD